MATIRAVVAYVVAAVSAIVAGLLIVFAPEGRDVAANVVAGAFAVLAAGIVGFTWLRVSFPAFRVDAKSSN